MSLRYACRRAGICAASLAALSCTGARSTAPLPAGGIHVLIVGNSYTYVNDLPSTLSAIANSMGDTLEIRSATGGNLALIDHLNGGSDAVQQLRQEHWDFVILQQGPTPAGMCRDSLILWTKMFDPYIRAAGAKPALFMTWPGVSYYQLFDEVRVSFEAAAYAVDGTFMPAGEAWRSAWAADSTLPLYGGDGVHPSQMGSFLAALEIYERLTGRDATTLPVRAYAGGTPITMPVETIRLLQRAAHDANVRFPAHSAPTSAELAAPSLYHSSVPSC